MRKRKWVTSASEACHPSAQKGLIQRCSNVSQSGRARCGTSTGEGARQGPGDSPDTGPRLCPCPKHRTLQDSFTPSSNKCLRTHRARHRLHGSRTHGAQLTRKKLKRVFGAHSTSSQGHRGPSSGAGACSIQPSTSETGSEPCGHRTKARPFHLAFSISFLIKASGLAIAVYCAHRPGGV